MIARDARGVEVGGAGRRREVALGRPGVVLAGRLGTSGGRGPGFVAQSGRQAPLLIAGQPVGGARRQAAGGEIALGQPGGKSAGLLPTHPHGRVAGAAQEGGFARPGAAGVLQPGLIVLHADFGGADQLRAAGQGDKAQAERVGEGLAGAGRLDADRAGRRGGFRGQPLLHGGHLRSADRAAQDLLPALLADLQPLFLGLGQEDGAALLVLEHAAEADRRHAQVHRHQVQVGGTQALRPEVGPGAAAQHADLLGPHLRIPAPFPDVAGQVVQALRTGGKLADRSGVAKPVVQSGHLAVGEVGGPGRRRPGGAPGEGAFVGDLVLDRQVRLARAQQADGRIPLVPRRQPVGLRAVEPARGAVLVGEPGAEGAGVLQRDADDRVVGPLLERRLVAPGVAAFLQKSLPVRHPRLVHGEQHRCAGDGDKALVQAAAWRRRIRLRLQQRRHGDEQAGQKGQKTADDHPADLAQPAPAVIQNDGGRRASCVRLRWSKCRGT